MDHPQPRIPARIRHHLRTKDHSRQGRFRTPCPHAHRQRRPEPDARERRTFKDRTYSHRRNDGTRTIDHRIRKHKPNIIFPPRTSSGSPYKHLLGRQKPLCTRTSSARMGSKERHVPIGKPTRRGQPLRHFTEADCGDALARWIG